LVKAEPNTPLRKYVEHIRSAGERATRLTQQLLTFSRKTSADVMPVDLNTVLIGMEQMMRRTIGEHIDLKLNLAQDLKLFRADKAQVEQVILNLVVNARDAMPNGGKLTFETTLQKGENIQSNIVAGPLSGEWVVLNVTDTGSGMSPEVQAHLFEPFFTTKPKGKGTGLGLSIVYGIVRHSGGHVTVSSYAGLGSTFTVCMPASADLAPKKDTDLEEMFVPGTETLLVAEDEEMVRQMLASCLQACGYQVLEASNGAEALKICSTLNAPLDLLITDSVMPKMSGKELSLRVRALFPNIPVLLMSGHIEDESETQAPGESMEFLQKPAKPSELTRRVRDILDKKKSG
jgi:CheY-like chemotaxis protein